MNKNEGAISAPLDCLVRQQEYALSHASHLRLKASEYRQMGFKEISRFCEEQAAKAERWASRIFAV